MGFCALGQRPVGLYIRKYFIIRRRPKRISDWGEGEANGIGNGGHSQRKRGWDQRVLLGLAPNSSQQGQETRWIRY